MASIAFLSATKNLVRKARLVSTFSSLPTLSSLSLPFSTLCRKHNVFVPPVSPPTPKKVPFTVFAHRTSWQDPYYWMSDVNDPDFIRYLQQESSYADAFMKDTSELQRTLYSEMLSRMPAKISTPPERWGPWLYYQHVPEGKEYPVLCRKLVNEGKGWIKKIVDYMTAESVEEILLDWNEIALLYGYVHVGTCRVSPDHNFLAYTLDITGSENFVLQIKDLKKNRTIPDYRVESVVSLTWAQAGQTLFYTLCDQNQRPYRVQCLKLGSESVDNTPLFVENDSRFCVDITSTKDGKFITVNSSSRTSSEVYIIDAINPHSQIQRFRKRESGVQYFLEHHHGLFYVLTNAPISKDEPSANANYYLAICRADDLLSNYFQNVFLPSENMCLLDLDIFNEHLVLFLNRDGTSAICSIDLPFPSNCKSDVKIDDLNPWFFPLPSNICSISPGSNHDFTSSIYRVVISSPVMPDVVVDYDISRKSWTIVHQEVVTDVYPRVECSRNIKITDELLDTKIEGKKSGQKNEAQLVVEFSSTYSCEKKEVISHDGVRVPLTILCSRKVHKEGQSPGLLHVYGAYGEVLDKSWCSDYLSLLDGGWVIAFADVRGGAGADPAWHRSGSGMHKLNSIFDFVSCGKYLLDENYVHEQQLATVAHSAGCLVVGAAINMCPHLFRAAILKVPFLDICNTLLNPNLPLTVLDYEEFGNPQIESEFHNILKYSPYNNIAEGVCCPAMLVTSSFNDSRVGIWEAAKWVARIRDIACPTCSSSVILRSNMDGGHFSEGGRFGHCEETAYEYAFLMKSLGISDKVPKDTLQHPVRHYFQFPNSWDYNLFSMFLPQDDMQRLQLVYLEEHLEDILVLSLTANGQFSSKSLQTLLHIPPRLSFFLWQACHER